MDQRLVTTRWATPDDVDAVVALLPRLADYELPENREPEMFWGSDAELARRWARGEAPDSVIKVGCVGEVVKAAAIVTFNADHFSGERNAHLEAIVVAPDADGLGLGRRLIAEMEAHAATDGAQTMSLHVMGNNHRARHVYERIGYGEEMIRAVKFLGAG